MIRSLLLSLVCFGILSAQDAELVLRTTVGYGTMLASRPLADEQKAEAKRLGAAAQAAAAGGKYGDAMRS